MSIKLAVEQKSLRDRIEAIEKRLEELEKANTKQEDKKPVRRGRPKVNAVG